MNLSGNITKLMNEIIAKKYKLREKDVEYDYVRKNAFYNHIKDRKESKKLKDKPFQKNLK